MTFAAINWLNISINLLLVVFFIVCLLMVLLILMQRPKQEGLGATFGTNVTDQVFGARTTNVLQKGTVYLGTAFFVLSLLLAVLIGKRNTSNSLINRDAKPAAAEAPAQPEPQKSLAEQAQEAGQTIPVEVKPAAETPAAPSQEAAPAETAPAAPAVPTEAPKAETPPAPATPETQAAPAVPAEIPATPAGEEKPAAP